MPYTKEDKENDRIIKMLYSRLDKFNSIYENGNEVNPLPDKTKITVFCKSDNEEGFAINSNTLDLGLSAFIAKKWIIHSELEKIVGESLS